MIGKITTTVLLSTFFVLSFFEQIQAQGIFGQSRVQNRGVCGFHDDHDNLREKYPEIFREYERKKQIQREYLKKWKSSSNQRVEGTVYTIPLVFHIIHTGDAQGTIYNPSDAEINAAVAFLNDRFTNNPQGDIEIRFVLAKRAPDCTASDGIVRVNGTTITNYVANGIRNNDATAASELAVKGESRWDHTSYYNIWVVNKIDGEDGNCASCSFTAGYAYPPAALLNTNDGVVAPQADVDGTVILARDIILGAGSTTLAHEVGHGLNLLHTFQDAGSCPSLNSPGCDNDGDEVCDTKPHPQGNFDEFEITDPIGICSGAYGNYTDNERLNIMAYFDHPPSTQLFTSGQTTRMRTALEDERPSLITSLGDEAPTGGALPTAPTSALDVNGGAIGGCFGITRFEFQQINNISASSGGDGAAYVDFANSCAKIATADPGSTYSFTVDLHTTNAHEVEIYLDLNNDGDFDDANERLYQGTGSSTLTDNITIPSTGILTNQIKI